MGLLGHKMLPEPTVSDGNANLLPATKTPVPPVGSSEHPDDVVTGVRDDWEPKKRNFLQRFIDGYLIANGGHPAFKEKFDEQNLKGALQDYRSDPEAAIKRLQRIPGYETKAITMYEHLDDETRKKQSAAILDDIRKERFRSVVRNALGGMKGTYDSGGRQRLQQYLDQHEISDMVLPEKWDDNAINEIRYQGITPDQDIDNDRADRNTDSMISNRENSSYNRTRNTDSMISNRAARLGETQRHNRVMESKPGRAAKAPDRYKARAGKAFKGPNGSLVEFNRDGKGMKVTHPSGKVLYFKVGVDGRPVKVGEE